ncbi:hypothetical protein QBC41DRAFT_283450 [Cercophora samala]|uniref:Uncharacterized protein n=1 Tax=Cercophora samala TaxID=330535 RepID=A0AA39Z6T9_9PEZI|nr:hypothetical protein QBC41DRAFT_283450 [Cercophora samala]
MAKAHANFTMDSWGLDTTLHLPNSFCPSNSPGVQKTEVTAAIDTFCSTRFQKDIMTDGRQSQLLLLPSPQDDYPERRIPTWLSVSTWASPPASHNCTSTSLFSNYTLSVAECKEAFSYANLNCTAFSEKFTQGGSMPGYCLAYEIFTNNTYDPASPPWLNPVPEQNRPDCGDGQIAGNKEVKASNIETSFWAGMYTKFCNTINAHSDGGAINGAWSMEHEDPRGCVVYTITAFYRTRRLLEEEEREGTGRSGNLGT